MPSIDVLIFVLYDRGEGRCYYKLDHALCHVSHPRSRYHHIMRLYDPDRRGWPLPGTLFVSTMVRR